MIYVFDTGVFSVWKHFYAERFPTLWDKLQENVDDDIITSVKEVRRELRAYEGETPIDDWAKNNPRIFTPPGEAEQKFVQWLMTQPRGQMLVAKRTIKKGTPVADPWLIAKARHINGTVVTTETRSNPPHNSNPKQGKIPDVCDGLKIPCINLEEFMREQEWKF